MKDYHKYLHKHKELAPNAMKGLSIPYRLFAKCELKAKKKQSKVKAKVETIGVNRPGGVVFTSGFSNESK